MTALGNGSTVMVADPVAVPVAQRLSATPVTVYVVVAAGATVRTAGEAATVWVNPSDQTTVQGPVPVSAALICEDCPSQMVASPLTVAVGGVVQVVHVLMVTVAVPVAVQPADVVTVTPRSATPEAPTV